MSQPSYGNGYQRNLNRSYAYNQSGPTMGGKQQHNPMSYQPSRPSPYRPQMPSPASRYQNPSQPPAMQAGQYSAPQPSFQAYSPPNYQGPYRMGSGGNFTPGTQQGPPSYHMPTGQWQGTEQNVRNLGYQLPQIQGGMNTWNPGLNNGPAASSTWQENQNQYLNQMRSLGHGVTDDGRVQFGLPTNPLQDPWIVENLRQQQANQLQQQMFTAMGRPLLGNTIMASPYNSYRGATDWGMTGGDPVSGIQSSTLGFHFGYPGQEEIPFPSPEPFPFAPWMIPRQGG